MSKEKEEVDSFGEYLAKITAGASVILALNQLVENITPIRPRRQIKQRLSELRKKLTCRICGYKGIAKLDYDGQMECSKCKNNVEGNWIDYGEYKALKWVLSYRPKKKRER
jgi:ribosomal protein L37AE/L43A